MDVLRRTIERAGGGEDLVLVTVVGVGGSVPPRVGFRMLVAAGDTEGTVGGGALELEAIRLARALLASDGGARLEHLDVSELDMACGGEVSLFLEPFRAAPALWIFGGGHVAKALVPMAAATGWRVTVVDNRPEFADLARFPGAAATISAPYDEAAPKVPAGAFAVIVTHGHAHDEMLLEAMARIKPKLPYIGMIGSSRKIAEALSRIREAGVATGSNIQAPIGLDLGGDSPGEIALCIAAQLQGLRHGKPGLPHYRDRRAAR
ncbi:MAG TPA: XdhC/CoxI family protein [Polyangia bacterium]|nr:XdhC/CoxI family protein [Polyangia bacterium]